MNTQTISPTASGRTSTRSAAGTAAELGKYVASFGVSLGITSVLSALLVVLKETQEETVLAWMKAATGHHWITHGIIDVLLFVALGFGLAGILGGLRSRPSVVAAVSLGGVIAGALIIVGFYL